MTLTITNQEEFDAIPKDFEGIVHITKKDSKNPIEIIGTHNWRLLRIDFLHSVIFITDWVREKVL